MIPLRVGSYGRRGTALLLLWLVASPIGAQSFDNFDGSGSLEFTLDPEIEVDPLTDPEADPLEFEETPDEPPLEAPPNDTGFILDAPEPDVDLTPGTNPEDDILLRSFPSVGSDITSVSQPTTTLGTQVTLRALDKTLGRPTDLTMEIGDTALIGRIAITAVECRYPSDDPNSDAYANLAISDTDGNSLFGGWMIASSPALSALEHPRYDVWVLRCEAP